MGSFNMEVFKEWSDLRVSKYQLPNVKYHKGSYYLDSEAELAHVEAFNRPRPFWNYTVKESPDVAAQVLPSAKQMTSLTFLGDRRQHPSLRLRVYSVLQH